jgi:hypothetical protein|tara:strand:+ start:1014 stop:1784 length:771 start_codon:yes stop_codon:yes gene_type:complete
MSDKKIYGPDVYKRNEHGLLGNADYEFNEDGSVNWRAMIKEEFLYPNKDWFASRKKDVPSSVEGLSDKQLLIMLGGIKELARLRGFESVSFRTDHISDNYVVANCEIAWSPNYESNNQGVVYQDVANATLQNTDAFCAKFLETIACNRAFVRCVRNYLNIHIVGADEIDKSKGANNSNTVEYDASSDSAMLPLTPAGTLQKALSEELGVKTFEDFKALLRTFWKQEKYRNEEAANWESYGDIPPKDCRKLILICKS